MKRELACWLLSKGMGEGGNLIPWLRKAGSQFLIDYNFPIHIYLELSRSCNYNCRMCAREKNDNGYMPLGLASRVVEECGHYGPTSFSLHLYGEPLLSPNLENVIKIIKQVNPKNVILLTTNGSLLIPEICKMLVKHQVDVVYVSIPSLEVMRYFEMTGCKGVWGDVVGKMTGLLELRENNHKPKVIARVFEEVGNGHNMIVPLCDRMDFRKYHNFGGNNTKHTQYKLNNRYPCYHPWFTLAVTYNGDVNVCCSDYYGQLFYGNLYQNNSLAKIWKSKGIQSLREIHLKNKLQGWGKCANCDVWNVKPDIFYNWQKG